MRGLPSTQPLVLTALRRPMRYRISYHLDFPDAICMTERRYIIIETTNPEEAKRRFWEEIKKDADWPRVERIIGGEPERMGIFDELEFAG